MDIKRNNKNEIRFKKAAQTISLSAACELYKKGIALSCNDGKDITFIVEKNRKCC